MSVKVELVKIRTTFNRFTKLSDCQSFWKSQISNLFISAEQNIGYKMNCVFITELLGVNKSYYQFYFTFELRGGRWSRFPAKMRSTVASSRVILMFFEFYWWSLNCPWLRPGHFNFVSFFMWLGVVAGYLKFCWVGVWHVHKDVLFHILLTGYLNTGAE